MSTPGSKEIEGRSADTDSGEGVSPTQELQVAENTQPTSGAVTNQEEQQQQPQRTSGWQIVKSMATRLLFIYLISSFFKRSPSNTQPGAATGPLPSANLFMKGAYLDMFVYVSENEVFTEFNKPEFLFWSEFQVVYGDWNSGPYADGSYVKSGEIAITEAMQNNGSIYLHVFFTEAGHSPNPDDTDNYNRLGTFHRSKRLNRYKKKHYAKTMNLLTGQTVATAEEIKKAKEVGSEVLSHWHPNLTINLLDDQTHWVKGSVPPPLDQYIEFEPSTGRYYPAIFLNDYWNLNADYQPINASLQTLTLTLTLAPIASWKWQMYAAQTAKKSWWVSWMDEGAEENDDDQDTVKKAFLDTNPYLLAVTVAVSVLHSIFEFLAFKNDIQFWRTRESLEGLSARTVLFGVFQSVVVLLYVLDNEANTLVRISCLIGVGIDCWKVPKVLTITLDRSGVVPWPRFVYKGSYATSATSDFDKTAFKYLSWLLFPLLAGYAVYSLLYQEHKGWYSWMLGMVYGFLLTFGFIMMTPQLFINYKLKSVAHLPWRMMTYKALNTFIDDMFAFVIQMPTMYRIGCLRDDVIFFVYLYQRWIYRVDPKRFNEFGTTGEMAAGVEPSKAIGDTAMHEETTGKQKSE